MHAADQPYQDLWPGIPNRCSVVIAETFSRSGKSLAVLPPDSMSIRSRPTFSTFTRCVRHSLPDVGPPDSQPARAPKDARIPATTPNQRRDKLNDAFKH
jgi:hypothetical protein